MTLSLKMAIYYQTLVHDYPTSELNRSGALHDEPFAKCQPCLANLAYYGFSVRDIRRALRPHAVIQ